MNWEFLKVLTLYTVMSTASSLFFYTFVEARYEKEMGIAYLSLFLLTVCSVMAFTIAYYH